MTLPDFDIANIIGQKWEKDQKKEAQYHIHPEGQEGASNLGGCIALRSKKEAGIPLPRKEGVKADFGAAFVGTVWHNKIQVDIVEELKRLYPQNVVGPIIDPDGTIHEVITEDEILPGQRVVSPLDICMVSQPGFIKKTIQYERTTREVYVKHPDAKWLFIADIKSASPYSYNIHEKEGLGDEYDAQMLQYLHATGLKIMPVLFVNKLNAHRFTTMAEYTDEKWKALQEKRLREKMLAEIMKKGGICPFTETDFKYFTSDAEFICAYCALSETHEEERFGAIKVVLDKPCIEVVTRVEKEYEKKFREGSHWMSGGSMLSIEFVKDGKVYSHNKGGKQFDDTVFHAAKSYTEGWEKKEKVVQKPIIKPPPKPQLVYEDNTFSQPKPILLPPDFTDDEAFENIQKLDGRKCIVCQEPCEPTSKSFCSKHGPKISDTVGL